MKVCDSLNAGGMERVAVDLANELSLQAEVHLCVTRADGPLRRALRPTIPVHFLHRRRWWQGMLSFRQLIKTLNIDVVHAHGNSSAMFSVVALLFLPVKIVHHDHNPLLDFRSRLREFMLLRKVARWYCVSKPIYEWATKRVQARNAQFLPNPIDVSRFAGRAASNAPAREATALVVLANYKEHKDYDNLLAALQILTSAGKKATISCYGSNFQSAYFARIAARQQALQLENIFLNQTHHDIPSLLKDFDAGVLSSEFEGLPIALLEYMAAGLPVVVTEAGACGEVVRAANCGYVVPVKNSDELARALGEVISNPAFADQLGCNGRAYIEKNHSLAGIAKYILTDYQTLV